MEREEKRIGREQEGREEEGRGGERRGQDKRRKKKKERKPVVSSWEKRRPKESKK